MESNRFILLQVVLVTILGRTSGGSECVNGSATSTLPTQIHQGERVVNDGDALVTDFTALPCTSDPCSSRGCIRKCCPEGYAMNENTRECSLFDGQFNVDLQDENGAPVENLTLAFRAGAMPACAPEQLFDLDPAARPEDRFSVLPSGHLYKADFPKEQRKNSEYCVDNFIHDEKVVRSIRHLLKTEISLSFFYHNAFTLVLITSYGNVLKGNERFDVLPGPGSQHSRAAETDSCFRILANHLIHLLNRHIRRVRDPATVAHS